MYAYTQNFYDYASALNRTSALAVASELLNHLAIPSVVDFGCAQGAWLDVWRELGVKDILGVDGEYVDRNRLKIPVSHFLSRDLGEPVDLGRTFSLAQCLEVAEHLPAHQALTLIDNLTRHAPLVLFSAAPPGQGGEHHINEQPYEYWQRLFHQQGFDLVDAMRPLLQGRPDVQPWYRYNIFLFVRQDHLARLPEAFQRHRLDPSIPPPEFAPLLYQWRRKLIAILPYGVTQILAKIAARRR